MSKLRWRKAWVLLVPVVAVGLVMIIRVALGSPEVGSPGHSRAYRSTGVSVPALVSEPPEGFRITGSFRCYEDQELDPDKTDKDDEVLKDIFSVTASGGKIKNKSGHKVLLGIEFKVKSGAYEAPVERWATDVTNNQEMSHFYLSSDIPKGLSECWLNFTDKPTDDYEGAKREFGPEDAYLCPPDTPPGKTEELCVKSHSQLPSPGSSP